MNFKILIGLMLVGMLLLTGCNESSYNDCKLDCYSIKSQEYNSCEDWGFFIECNYDDEKEIENICFKECS